MFVGGLSASCRSFRMVCDPVPQNFATGLLPQGTVRDGRRRQTVYQICTKRVRGSNPLVSTKSSDYVLRSRSELHTSLPRQLPGLLAVYRIKMVESRLNCFTPLPGLPNVTQPEPVMSFIRTIRLFRASAT